VAHGTTRKPDVRKGLTMRLSALFAALGAAALAGCDYTVPLADKPEQAIDAALVGAWERTTADGETERLLVLPLSKTEYLVSFPAGSKNAMFARACLCKAADLSLVQLTWFGTARGAVPEDSRVYQFASCTVTGDTLKGRLLNADVVDRDAASSAALSTAIEANKENALLFREEMVFKKEKPPADPNAPFKRPPVPAAWR
jgi:hypothetical protein